MMLQMSRKITVSTDVGLMGFLLGMGEAAAHSGMRLTGS